MYNSSDERRILSIPTRLDTRSRRVLTLSRETLAVQEKMFVVFYASLARTGWFRAMKIVIIPVSPERLHRSDFDARARLMSSYLIISFLHLGSHYLFSMRSQPDKGRKVRQVKSVMRCCSHFHPLCFCERSSEAYVS